MRVRRVQLGGSGSPMPGTFAVPDGYPPGPAVVVIHEWWGLNGQIEMVAQRFAAQGFAAVVPDLYRGDVYTEPDEGEKRMMELDDTQALDDLRITVSFLKNQGATAVGVMGFCMGAWLAWEFAYTDDRVAATVPCYGLAEAKGRELNGAVQMHVGTEDDFETAELDATERLLAARRDGSALFRYEGADHAFMNDQRPEVYRKDDADLAWERATGFFADKLGAPLPV